MKNKKKLLVVLACLALCVCTVVTGTLAWLTDKTETVTNTFSPSNIQLTLTETWNADSNDADTKPDHWEIQMIPSETHTKDPIVTVTADIASYVFIKVEKVNNPDTYLDYSIATGWTPLKDANGVAVAGVFYREVPANPADGFPVLTNNQVTVKSTITTAEMATAANAVPELKFTAYAIQQLGFADAAAAWEVAKNLP